MIVRDVLGKMVKWIDHFKKISDIAIQYDPVHAALPWAGVRFLLQVSQYVLGDGPRADVQQIATNDFHTFGVVLEKLSLIAERICRYALVEELLLRSPSHAAEGLQRALVQLYTRVLDDLARARGYFLQHSGS